MQKHVLVDIQRKPTISYKSVIDHIITNSTLLLSSFKKYSFIYSQEYNCLLYNCFLFEKIELKRYLKAFLHKQLKNSLTKNNGNYFKNMNRNINHQEL